MGRNPTVWYRVFQPYSVLRLFGKGEINLVVIHNLIADSVIPVVCGYIIMPCIDISADIILSPYMPHSIPGIRLGRTMTSIGRCPYTDRRNSFIHIVLRTRTRSRLIVVIDDIHIHTLTTIAAVSVPVIHHAVTKIHPLVLLSSDTRTETRTTTDMKGKKIMMI